MQRALTQVLVCLCAGARMWGQGSVVFDDSRPDRMRVAARTYELTFSKSNGAILGITDRVANAALTLGSRNGCLWGMNFQTTPATYRGGCNFSAGRPDAFTYSWDDGQSLLTLRYISGPASPRVDAAVMVTVRSESFDLKLAVVNRSGSTLYAVLFPSDLLFADASLNGAYLPYYLPGVRLRPEFFGANRSITVTYPGARAFADYVAFEANGGRLAYYVVNPEGKVAPVTFGFQDDDRTRAGTFYAFHTFQCWTPDGSAFATPIVRVRVGQEAAQTIALYRNENGIADYPGLAEKLGELAPAVAAAPLVKMDMRSIGRTFAELAARLDSIRVPAILHPVSYWQRGFDQNYPDFLPPDERFGATTDFRQFVEAAHARDFFVMPYTNPTWWDDQSPTVRNAPDLAALAVIAPDGKPVYESYGVNRGFVASPHSPAVQARVSNLMAQWRDEVPVDFVLQDQIGSRSWIRDFNPAASDPQTYSDAWLAVTRLYASQRLMTEDGWDRLAATEVGFSGSALTGTTAWKPQEIRWGAGSRANQAFGAGLWEPYPLGVWLFHDKVLFYHHDLDNLPMNGGAETLTWNAAFGVNAGYYWPELRSASPDWAAIAAAFQPAVMARSAGRMLTSYRGLGGQVVESRFDDLVVTANWNAESPYPLDGFVIAPSGFLARTDGGSVTAGIFAGQFNGAPLSPGLHYVTVARSGGVITVRHPSGPDSTLSISIPADWDSASSVQVRSIGAGGRTVGTVAGAIEEGRVSFACGRTGGTQPVERYEIALAP